MFDRGLAARRGRPARPERPHGSGRARTRPRRGAASTPLPPELEKIRAAEATKLYGGPAERPLAERSRASSRSATARSPARASAPTSPARTAPTTGATARRTPPSTGPASPADVTYNVSCSGAYSGNIRIGGSKQYADELVQSDNLAIKARNTKIKMVVLVAGANDDLQFGPVMTDCVTRWFLLQGACEPKYQPGWQARVDGLTPKVDRAPSATCRRSCGTRATPTATTSSSSWATRARSAPTSTTTPASRASSPAAAPATTPTPPGAATTPCPPSRRGMRKAAKDAGAVYLDNSRLFHGHEVCMEDTWARGLYVDVSNPFPPDSNSLRQSFHPNARGHAAFASCLTQLYNSGLTEAGCADPASTGSPKLYAGGWDDAYKPLKNAATGTCADAKGAGHPQRHERHRLGLLRRPQPGLVARPGRQGGPHRVDPRPLPGRAGRASTPPARPSRSGTATAAPTSSSYANRGPCARPRPPASAWRWPRRRTP